MLSNLECVLGRTMLEQRPRQDQRIVRLRELPKAVPTRLRLAVQPHQERDIAIDLPRGVGQVQSLFEASLTLQDV